MCALRSPQESTVEDRRWSSNEKDAPRLWPDPRGCCVRASAPWLGGGRRLPDEQSPPSPGYDPHQDTRTERGRVGGPCIGGGDDPGGDTGGGGHPVPWLGAPGDRRGHRGAGNHVTRRHRSGDAAGASLAPASSRLTRLAPTWL